MIQDEDACLADGAALVDDSDSDSDFGGGAAKLPGTRPAAFVLLSPADDADAECCR